MQRRRTVAVGSLRSAAAAIDDRLAMALSEAIHMNV